MLYIIYNLFNNRPDLNIYIQNTPFYLETQINNIMSNNCISAITEIGKFVLLKNYHLNILHNYFLLKQQKEYVDLV